MKNEFVITNYKFSRYDFLLLMGPIRSSVGKLNMLLSGKSAASSVPIARHIQEEEKRNRKETETLGST
jgi:hypothetical protein